MTRVSEPRVSEPKGSSVSGLQIITIVWMYLIFKIAYKVVTGTGAEDVRSDDEETDVEDESVTEKVK
ncbi:hypothetical protein QCA50_011996 [Cerrena zonata]|uniref:Uncharacterized protein n=1 Tax=Cerrena zonata TaxID=2478898 RepID=A0AAW0G061_9APHY